MGESRRSAWPVRRAKIDAVPAIAFADMGAIYIIFNILYIYIYVCIYVFFFVCAIFYHVPAFPAMVLLGYQCFHF